MLDLIRRIADSPRFDQLIIALILLTAAIIGLEAFPEYITPQRAALFGLLHNIILGAFIVDR